MQMSPCCLTHFKSISLHSKSNPNSLLSPKETSMSLALVYFSNLFLSHSFSHSLCSSQTGLLIFQSILFIKLLPFMFLVLAIFFTHISAWLALFYLIGLSLCLTPQSKVSLGNLCQMSVSNPYHYYLTYHCLFPS